MTSLNLSKEKESTSHGSGEWISQNADKLVRVMVFTMIITMMNATMFNIFLPEISQEYGLTYGEASWISSAYLLVYAIGSVFYGKMADRYRLKSIVTAGLLVFAVGSLLGIISHAYVFILFSRILQAAGASVIPALSMVVPVRFYPVEKRGRVLGIMASGLALGGVLGPLVSSFVAGFFHWRWLFFLPICTLLTIPIYRRYLAAESKRSSHPIDWFGGFALGGAVASLLIALSSKEALFVIVAIVLFLLFVARVITAEYPFVEQRLFTNRKYVFGLILAFLVTGIGFIVPFLTPMMLSDVYQLDSGLIGFLLIPAALAAALLGKQGGKLADSKGSAFLFIFSASLLFTAFLSLAFFIGHSLVSLVPVLILAQVGQTFIVVALSGTVASTLDQRQVGIGMGLMSMFNFIGSSVAGVIFSLLVDQGIEQVNAGVFYNELYLFLPLAYVILVIMYVIVYRSRKDEELIKEKG